MILPGRAEATLFEMAAASATLEEAAATFGTSVEPIEKKAESLGIQLRRRVNGHPFVCRPWAGGEEMSSAALSILRRLQIAALICEMRETATQRSQR